VSDSIERLRAEFLSETEDTLAHLHDDLNELQAGIGGTLPPDALDRVFRTTHSLKGVAGMFGLDAMSSVAHALENVLDGLRERRFPLDAGLLDLLHRGHEALASLLAVADAGDAGDAAAREAAARLADVVMDAVRERERAVEAQGTPFERAVGRLTPAEAAAVRRAAAAGRTIAVVEVEYPEEGFETAFRELLATVRAWGTVHGTATAGRDLPRRTFRAQTVASGDGDTFALVRAVMPLGAVVLLDDLAPAPAAASAVAPPAPPRPPPSPPPPPAVPPRPDLAVLRVPLERVDRLLAELAEVVQAKARLDEAIADTLGRPAADRTRATTVRQSLRDLDRRLGGLRDRVLGLRTVRLDPLLAKLERAFREACRLAGREPRFVATGGDTELDKNTVEALTEPLVHLVRNAVDHGIEDGAARRAAGKDPHGMVWVAARSEGNRAILDVGDDGGGVDYGRVLAKAQRLGLVEPHEDPTRARLVELLFHPGLTVKDAPTALSGRGVGLDVVRDSVARLGGVLDVDTGPQGTVFRLSIPTSLVVLSALEVESGGQAYYLPLPNIVRAVDVEAERIGSERGRQVVTVDGERVAARELGPARASAGRGRGARRAGVLLAVADRRALLWVDHLGRQRDIAVRSLGGLLPAVPGVAGCAETADGRTILVLDPASLLDAPFASAASAEAVS